MNPKIGQNVVFRLQPMYLEAIRLLALEKHMTPSEYLREEVIRGHLQAKTRERTAMQFGGAALQFSHHVKEYTDLALSMGLPLGIPIASGLPSDKRRDDLEALIWKAIQDAADFMKTEEAAKNAKARIHVMEVMAATANVHLEILKYQDQAAVAPLLERVKAGLHELEKTTGKSSGTAGS